MFNIYKNINIIKTYILFFFEKYRKKTKCIQRTPTFCITSTLKPNNIIHVLSTIEPLFSIFQS